MTNNKWNSIAGQVVRAMKTGGNPAEVEARLLSELTKPLQDWINAQAEIDSFYVAFVLEIALRTVYGNLDAGDREQLENLKSRISCMGVVIPVKEDEA